MPVGHEPVPDLTKTIPFRYSPAPASERLPHPSTDPSPVAGAKRSSINGLSPATPVGFDPPPLKKLRQDRGSDDEELMTGDQETGQHNPEVTARNRDGNRNENRNRDRERRGTSNLSFLQAAATTMLNRGKEPGTSPKLRSFKGLPPAPTNAPSSVLHSNGHSRGDRDVSTRQQDPRPGGAHHALESSGLLEFLQQDERPVFVVADTDNDSVTDGLDLVFANVALRSRPAMFDCILGRLDETALLLDLGTPFFDFRSWIASSSQAAAKPSFYYGGATWKCSTLRKGLKVLTGRVDQSASPSESKSSHRPALQQYKGLSSSSANTVRKKPPDSAGYFDVQTSRARSQTPGTVDRLVNSSHRAESPDSPAEVASIGPSASNGDSGMSDLLQSAVSPPNEPPINHFPVRSNPENLQSMSMGYLSDKGFYDWTRMPLHDNLPEHIRFARSVNWANTSLGPVEEWSADLRGMCNLIMASPHPAAMYWGSDHVAIYNEPYIMLAGQKHPGLMGSRYADAWSEIWEALEDVFHLAMTTAEATMKDDDCLFVVRNGFLEETYFSWSIIPLIGDDGSVVGLYNPAFEKTRRKIAERRMLTLREIGEKTGIARAVSQFWALLIEGFKYNEYDAPLVIVYSLGDSEDSDAVSSTSSTAAALKHCHLEGTLGVPRGHAATPEVIDLKHDTSGFGAFFKRAITAEKPIVLTTEAGTLDPVLLEGIEWRGFGDPSPAIVISPIRPTSGDSTLGFLVMGTNPRRPYDDDYDLFVQLLSRQLATSIASVVLFEEEIRKSERAARMAAQDRIELSNQLAARTQEAVESENKFTRMAELAPVGMFIGDARGRITFANDAWYALTSFPKDLPIGDDWIKYVRDEDQPVASRGWSDVTRTKSPISTQFRFQTPWRDGFGNQSDTWVIVSMSPEKDEDDEITRVFGSVTNISSQKSVEALQTRRMEEAVLMKQQQERYIDTTSHEMRNPLSAILQSADSITGSLVEMRGGDGLNLGHLEAIDGVIESAQTITLCAQHQKRIVDDVLTLSKLDSAMLLVTPVDVQPTSVARRALKMFEGELHTADIPLEVHIDKSYHQLDLDWVRLDPTRLSQVLINLMTNAIKFTTTQEKRLIRMHVAASKEKPSSEDKWALTYIAGSSAEDTDPTTSPEWGTGELVYIHFAVQDTGRGLSATEKKQLFQRFSQANPRTHVTYGGSGLGLFISRMLVELQGGEIGVASESGKGSTFAFYVKARRSQAPPEGSEDDQNHLDLRKMTKGTGKLTKVRSNATGGSSTGPALPSPNTTSVALSKSKLDATGLKVLIVEDNLINQNVLARQLKKIGCVVCVANHGGEAIDQIKRSRFYHQPVSEPIEISVVLMDLEMPVMDGQTCARELRRMQVAGEVVRHIPVIAVTANAREEQIRETLESGIDDVVSKPFRIPELVPKMKATIAKFAATTPPVTSGRSPVRSGQAIE